VSGRFVDNLGITGVSRPSSDITKQPADHPLERSCAPDAAQIRFRVDPADIPPEKAARRLHLTLDRFNEVLPNLLKRGFPRPDLDTGMYDLDAIDAWRRARHRSTPLTADAGAPQGGVTEAPMSAAERFLAAKRQTEIGGRRRGAA
jgi:hypothetical protein